jgi:hypothetical protein
MGLDKGAYEVRTVYIGIDPGVSGGIASIFPPENDGVASAVYCTSMPKTEGDVWEWISRYHGYDYTTYAFIEAIAPGFPGTSKSSMAKLYGSYRALRMALIAAAIPFEEVRAAEWQSMMKIPPRKRKVETDTQWKNRLKARAQQLFPKVNVTLATADALLIALYCQRKHEGTL